MVEAKVDRFRGFRVQVLEAVGIRRWAKGSFRV